MGPRFRRDDKWGYTVAMTDASPMMAQYLAIKAQAAGCLLFFRMGDFYELFFDDAAKAAATLDIALTARGTHDGAPIPMCGVPVHAAETYLQRLIRAGHRVAIAEQIEAPAEAKKRGAKSVVARAIVRVVTSGTLTEDALLDARASNWLAAIAPLADGIGLAWCDVSTGAFRTQASTAADLDGDLARIAPAEIVAPDGWSGAIGATPIPRPPADFDSRAASRRLCDRFGVATLDGFGAFTRAEVAAAGALIAYLDAIGPAPLLTPPVPCPPAAVMAIDAATRISLEISRSAGGIRAGSLLDALDRTVTGGGARLLADDLGGPLTDATAIGDRLDLVGWFLAAAAVRETTRAALKAGPDVERALARLAVGRGGPRDLGAIRDGLAVAVALKAALLAASLATPPLLTATLTRVGAHGSVIEALRAALVAAPPGDAAGGGFIAPGFDAALDELRAAAHDGRRLVAALETRLRGETGVTGLKIRHNNVLGYHIEVAARAADPLLADPGFTHRQTLAGVVRFGSVELHGLATRIAHAGDHALVAEAAHFEDLRAAVLGHAGAIAATAGALARLDVASALAERATDGGWVRPTVDSSCAFAVIGGRHPVVEAAQRAARRPFVANDCDLSDHAQSPGRVWLVTGPNMAGKSTFLRQNALLAVLAQAGSFVPAATAHIGVVDRLFSRVGASDNLAQGRSTFMVEMVETAAILSTATARSLVILDEVGRGTSTYDGLAIAWAVLEAVHDTVRARCLFATHYHELTLLKTRLDAVALVTVKVREWQGELVFLHTVVPGAADRSYGLAVAKLAGLPAPVIARAKTVLARLEAGKARTGGLAADLSDLPLFAAAPAPEPIDALRVALAAIEPDQMSPRDALDELYALKRLA